jgi:hypothetical protein
VRFSLLCASSALAASLLLSACSGGSQAVPGGSQAIAPMGHHSLHLVAASPGNPSANCPSSLYITCIDITKASGGAVEICISTSGNCSSGLVGDWNWKTVVTKLSTGKNAKRKIHNKWSPNPGNPSTDTFTEVRAVKPSQNGSVKYVGTLTACEVTNPSSCLSGAIGLIPQ